MAELPWEAPTATAVLPLLCRSRLLGAWELRSLVASSRGHCEALARPEVLESLMLPLELGFAEMRGACKKGFEQLSRTVGRRQQPRGLAGGLCGA